jgi:hypothetical protein
VTGHRWNVPKVTGATATCVNCGLHRRKRRRLRTGPANHHQPGATVLVVEFSGDGEDWNYYRPKCGRADV